KKLADGRPLGEETGDLARKINRDRRCCTEIRPASFLAAPTAFHRTHAITSDLRSIVYAVARPRPGRLPRNAPAPGDWIDSTGRLPRRRTSRVRPQRANQLQPPRVPRQHHLPRDDAHAGPPGARQPGNPGAGADARPVVDDLRRWQARGREAA